MNHTRHAQRTIYTYAHTSARAAALCASAWVKSTGNGKPLLARDQNVPGSLPLLFYVHARGRPGSRLSFDCNSVYYEVSTLAVG